MPFKIVLILAVVVQIATAAMALRINRKYRFHSAWILISSSAALIAILQAALLGLIWSVDIDLFRAMPLWIACLSALLVSVLFFGGVALIEPLFKDIAKAQDLLEQENKQLETTVQQTEDELRLAREIQINLLPKTSPDIPGFDVAGDCRPAKWASGDYYDYFRMGDGTWCVLVADVTGHGLGPALLMAETRAFLRVLAQSHFDTESLLALANRAIAADVDQGRFVTVFLAKIDPQSRSFIPGAAGHDAVLLREDGTTMVLKSQGPPLGVLEEMDLDSAPTVKFSDGDILLLSSDGIAESESPQKEPFGIDRMVDVARANRDKPAAEIVEALFQAVSRFTGDAPQRDDITAVIVKVEPV